MEGQEVTSLSVLPNFQVEPFSNISELSDLHKYVKMDITSEQSNQLNVFIQNIPTIFAGTIMSNAYTITFPDGLHHELANSVHGGKIGFFKDVNNQHIEGNAILNRLNIQASMMAAFSAMSIVTGQHYLNEINDKLRMIKMSMDKILEFLYEDKRSELISEVSFVKYAYQNYESIMQSEAQRIATIQSLQVSKKVAMKDIEFHITDLDAVVNAVDISNLDDLVKKAFRIKESLELAIQLFVMSSLLEVYYSQNYADSYIQYIKKDIIIYLDKCEKRMLADFSALSKTVAMFRNRGLGFKKIEKEVHERRISEFVDSLGSGEESVLRKTVKSVLDLIRKPTEYCICNNGELYLKQHVV